MHDIFIVRENSITAKQCKEGNNVACWLLGSKVLKGCLRVGSAFGEGGTHHSLAAYCYLTLKGVRYPFNSCVDWEKTTSFHSKYVYFQVWMTLLEPFYCLLVRGQEILKARRKNV